MASAAYKAERSEGGVSGPVLKSCLQKAIRRRRPLLAARAARALASIAAAAGDDGPRAAAVMTNVRHRLMIIALEDAGVAAPEVWAGVDPREFADAPPEKWPALAAALAAVPKSRLPEHVRDVFEDISLGGGDGFADGVNGVADPLVNQVAAGLSQSDTDSDSGDSTSPTIYPEYCRAESDLIEFAGGLHPERTVVESDVEEIREMFGSEVAGSGPTPGEWEIRLEGAVSDQEFGAFGWAYRIEKKSRGGADRIFRVLESAAPWGWGRGAGGSGGAGGGSGGAGRTTPWAGVVEAAAGWYRELRNVHEAWLAWACPLLAVLFDEHGGVHLVDDCWPGLLGLVSAARPVAELAAELPPLTVADVPDYVFDRHCLPRRDPRSTLAHFAKVGAKVEGAGGPAVPAWHLLYDRLKAARD